MLSPIVLVLSFWSLPQPSPPVARELKLTNTRWDQVQVEVRVGPSGNCADNPSVGTKTLRRGRSWGVVSPEVICWRRESVPGNAGAGWTAWEQDRLAPAQVREVTL